MASHPNANKIESQGSSSKSPQHQPKGTGANFEPLDKSSSNTLKRNPKMELSKQDLLKLLSYLEGELQAREVVIAALKSEKVKQLLHQSRHRPGGLSQSRIALQQDSYADSRLGLDCMSDHQIALKSLDKVVYEHHCAELRMAKLLGDMELRHRKVVQELEEEKQKHEHDTAQGDDITYGLEKERTRLKQELELEKQARKKLEKDLKKANDVLEEERNRQKQIVLLLLAERKKLIMKYVEERKRSEDLAQIVSEEKIQMNAMADGLEEESKKSLQMEAELEKQMAQFDLERQHLKSQVIREQRRISELEAELEKSKAEQQSLNKQLAEAHQVAMFQATVSTPRPGMVASTLHKTVPQATGTVKAVPWGGVASPHPDGEGSSQAGSPMMSSVAKVVQPTATVSSVPVCAPTTGIARSVSPAQSVRTALFSPNSGNTPAFQPPAESDQAALVTPRPSLAPTPGAKLYATSAGGKLTFHVSASAAAAAEAGAAAAAAAASAANVGQGDSTHPVHNSPPTQPQPPPKKLTAGRGVPPPVPPNKPVVPPKKDSVIGRKVEGPDGNSTGSKLGLVSKDKAPQVGRDQIVGPSACSVDSLHVPAPARSDPAHILIPTSGESTGSIDVASCVPGLSATTASLAPKCAAQPCITSSESTHCSSSTPASASVSCSPQYAVPLKPNSVPSPTSAVVPNLLSDCVPSNLDHCSRPQPQPELCITPKVDAV